MGGEAARTPVICLIIWVQCKSNELNSLILEFDNVLVQSFNRIIGKPQLTHLLDFKIFDDDDAKNLVGYGAMLSSDHFLPN